MARWHGDGLLWLSPRLVSRSRVSAGPGWSSDPLACPHWNPPGAGLWGGGRGHGGSLGEAFSPWPSAATGCAVFTAGGAAGRPTRGPSGGGGLLLADLDRLAASAPEAQYRRAGH